MSSKGSVEYRKKELYKLIVARSDILAAFYACQTMVRNVDDLGHSLYYPLFTAIVICYSRPFTENKPFGKLGGRWGKFSNTLYGQLHKEILDMRNKLIAHSDQLRRKVYILPPGTPYGPKNKELKSGGGAEVGNEYWELSVFPTIQALCRYLYSRLNESIEHELASLFWSQKLPPKRFELL